MLLTYSKEDFHAICHTLAAKDADLKGIIERWGLPPMWTRPALFQSLVRIMLEQQVSLASAYAAFRKLKTKIGFVTPAKIMALSAEDLKACYFSRQKIVYVKALAEAVLSGKISLKKISGATNDEIRATLKQIKGIGDWTVDVYLIHALQRADLFPVGDIALVNSLKHIKQLHAGTTKDDLLAIAESWRPYRTIASMLLWHDYINRKNINVPG